MAPPATPTVVMASASLTGQPYVCLLQLEHRCCELGDVLGMDLARGSFKRLRGSPCSTAGARA
jgi:hypothetical protein